MKMYIHSSYGVLVCKPMTLQAIEDSIPESELIEQNQDLQGESDVAAGPQSGKSDSPI